MNSDKFNEPLHYAKEFLDTCDKGLFDSMQSSPLFVSMAFEKGFTYGDLNISRRLRDGETVMPFNELRLYLNEDAGNARYWASQKNGILTIAAYLKAKTGGNALFIFLISQDENLNPSLAFDRDSDLIAIFVNSKLINLDKYRNYYMDNVRALCVFFAGFIYESMFCANFIAKVQPLPRNANPKQIKWAESQKHYVIIHRKDEMNRIGAVPNPRGGKTSEIRMAHTRRAHMRILRSAKFKKKQGQQILIKSCWVGPQEWRTNGSIYKIVS